MAGPWEKYQAQAAPASGGPWDKYKATPADDGPGAVDAAISGVANAMTFGLAPKIIGGVRAGIGKLQGEGNLGDLYDKYRTEQEQYDEGAEKASPKVNTAAGLAGGFLNPLNKFIPGGSLGKNVTSGIGVGALTGAAKSKHDLSSADEAEGLAKDTLIGGGAGAVGGVVGTAAGKAVSALPGLAKKGAAVLLGAPEDAVERLVVNPQGVNNAPEVPESVRRIKGLLDQLKGRVKDGSQESRKFLQGEETQHTGQDVANFFQSKIDDITARAEGALSPTDAATVNYLKAQQEPFLGENIDKVFSGSRVKNLVQDLQRKGNYALGPGQFSTPDDAAIKGVAQSVNSSLKEKSPAYADAMVDQARKTDLLNQLQSTFKTDQGLGNLLNRVRRDRAPFAEELFTRLDKEFGTTAVEDLRNSLAKEAFDKGATNGSRNVNLYSHILRDWANKNHIPFGDTMGAITGATVDKYGPAVARGGITAYQKVSGNPLIQDYLQGITKAGQSAGVSPNITPAVAEYLSSKYGKKQP